MGGYLSFYKHVLFDMLLLFKTGGILDDSE